MVLWCWAALVNTYSSDWSSLVSAWLRMVDGLFLRGRVLSDRSQHDAAGSRSPAVIMASSGWYHGRSWRARSRQARRSQRERQITAGQGMHDGPRLASWITSGHDRRGGHGVYGGSYRSQRHGGRDRLRSRSLPVWHGGHGCHSGSGRVSKPRRSPAPRREVRRVTACMVRS